MEDLIHEIVTCGPHFKEANNFIWPFKLRSPKRGMRRVNHSFINGGAWGKRGSHINGLVVKML
jgi:large subunit ribosomal protein L7e